MSPRSAAASSFSVDSLRTVFRVCTTHSLSHLPSPARPPARHVRSALQPALSATCNARQRWRSGGCVHGGSDLKGLGLLERLADVLDLRCLCRHVRARARDSERLCADASAYTPARACAIRVRAHPHALMLPHLQLPSRVFARARTAFLCRILAPAPPPDSPLPPDCRAPFFFFHFVIQFLRLLPVPRRMGVRRGQRQQQC